MKSLDAFGRPSQEFQVKTACGGYLSVCAFCSIVVLFFMEFRYFLQLESRDEMVIDQNQDQKYLNISLNITFPAVPCSVLHMNLIDPKKANVLHVVHEIYKQRLSDNGARIGLPIRDSLTNVALTSAELAEAGKHGSTVRTTHATPHLRCHSCFQSHIDEDDCCSTCDDVHNSFKARGWSEKPEGYVFGQCVEEAYALHPPQDREGCHVDATMHVRKVAATMHLGVGRHYKTEQVRVSDHTEFIASLDFTHVVHSLTFGPDFPGLVRVLDGRRKSAHEPPNSEHFQYDIHVIPTRYQEDGSDEVVSHQYSVTEYVKSIDQRLRHQELVAIGLWANYDFTPFEVNITWTRKSFWHFLVECCAILGGIYSVTGMLDNFVYQLNKSVSRGRGASSVAAGGLGG